MMWQNEAALDAKIEEIEKRCWARWHAGSGMHILDLQMLIGIIAGLRMSNKLFAEQINQIVNDPNMTDKLLVLDALSKTYTTNSAPPEVEAW